MIKTLSRQEVLPAVKNLYSVSENTFGNSLYK